MFVALLDESFDEIKSLDEIIKIETPRILDLSNPDPDASTTAVSSAKLRIERLNKALPLSQERIAAIDAETALKTWTEQADKLRNESDELYEELKQIYPPFLQQMMALFLKSKDNAAAFQLHLRRAPEGADTRFFPAMPFEEFWLNLRMPPWNNPGVVYPERQSPEQIAWAQQVALTTAMVEQQKALDLKFAPHGGQDWHEIQKIEQERQIAADEKFAAEQKERDQQSRDAHYQAVLENERRHVRGEI